MDGLILHAGAKSATLEQINDLPTPEPIGPWHRPIHHGVFIRSILSSLAAAGLKTAGELFGLSKDGARLFGVIKLSDAVLENTARLVLGVRSSTDESFAMSAVLGASVFVCDNLAFHGESIVFARKSTLRVNLTRTVEYGVSRVMEMRRPFEDQVGAWRNRAVTERDAERLFGKMLRERAIPDRYIGDATRNYFAPQPEWTDIQPNLWGIHNAVTRQLREGSVSVKLQHSQSATRFLNSELAAAA